MPGAKNACSVFTNCCERGPGTLVLTTGSLPLTALVVSGPAGGQQSPAPPHGGSEQSLANRLSRSAREFPPLRGYNLRQRLQVQPQTLPGSPRRRPAGACALQPRGNQRSNQDQL